MTRVLSCLSVCLAALVAVAACAPYGSGVSGSGAARSASREASAPAGPKPLVLAETAYRWVPVADSGVLDFSFVIRNPNPGFGATSTVLHVVMEDGAGATCFEDDLPVWPVRPGEVVVGGSSMDPDSEPAAVRFELRTPTTSWVPAARWLPQDFVPLRVSDLRLRQSAEKPPADLVGFPEGYSYFTGTVENSNAVGFDEYSIDILHRDALGKIVASYDNGGVKIPAHGRKDFRIDVPKVLPPGDRYEAYARPWYTAEMSLPIRTTTAGP